MIIAVIDSGIAYDHPDLAANMWKNPGEIPNDGIDNDGNGLVDDVFGYDFRSGDSEPMDPIDLTAAPLGAIPAMAHMLPARSGQSATIIPASPESCISQTDGAESRRRG